MSDLTYDTYITRLANMMPVSTASSDGGFQNFMNFVPDNINYAEQRIYRELDLVAVQVTDTSGTTSSGVRTLTLSTAQGTFITVDQINLITPAGALSSLGIRQPLMPVSPEYIDLTYPSASQNTALPRFYARRSDTLVIFGPSPDAGYVTEVIGIQRPAALSSANSSTPLTQYVPDLFMAAAMVHAYGYMKDFGATADNPQGAMSWEMQYKTLFASAEVEQARAKFASEGWTSEQPSRSATPPRV